jgi:DNA-binding transcriptional MerR regulator
MTRLTIGQLAKRAGVSTSMLRYYQEQGLLEPAARTAAGYRLYEPADEDTLTFIRRAQRLGFSLADIRMFLVRLARNDLLDDTVVKVAEERYLELERQLTELAVQRHEMEAFLMDFRDRASKAAAPAAALYQRLVERVCSHDDHGAPARSTLQWLLEGTGCALASVNQKTVLAVLRGQHIHIWREAEAYHILIPGKTAATQAALEEIAQIEADCHAHSAPQLVETDEGFVLIAAGEKAFLFAQFFLALESDTSNAA